MPNAKPVTAVEADNYTWWSDFLEARMVAIQSMLALGRTDAEIVQSIGTEPSQVNILIERARERQNS